MRKRPFLHRRESKISGGHLSRQEFFCGEISGFLEKREVFEVGGENECKEDTIITDVNDGMQSLTFYTKEECLVDRGKLKRKMYKDKYADTFIYPQGNTAVKSSPINFTQNKVSPASTPLDSRGSFENIDPKLKNYLENLGISQDDSFHNFPKKAHFRNLITEGSHMDVKSVAKFLPQQIFDVNHVTQTVKNQNLQEWRKSDFWGKDAEITMKYGQKWQKKKAEILKTNKTNFQLQVDLEIKKITNKSTDFNNINITDINTLLTKSNSTLSSEERIVLKRLVKVYEDFSAEEIASKNQKILTPDSGPWLQKIEKLQSQIKDQKKHIDKLKSIISPSSSQKEELKITQKFLENLKEELDLRKSYQDEYNDIHTGEKLYTEFFTPENTETGELEHLTNPAKSIKELGKYYEWIETKLFSEGIPLPHPKVRALLTSQVFSGKISVVGLSKGLRKLAGAPEREKKYQVDTLKNQEGVVKFYGEIALVLNTKSNSEEREKQAKYFLEKYKSTFDRKTLLEISSNINTWGEKISEKTPLELKQNRESKEKGLEEKYGVPPASMWEQWKQISTQPLQSGVLDNAQRPKTIGNVFPLETWFNESGTLNIPDENFIEFKRAIALSLPVSVMGKFHKNGEFKSEIIHKIHSQNWGKNDSDVILFLEEYNDYFRQRKTTESHIGYMNPVQATKKMQDEIKKSSETGKVTDFIMNAFDEAMDGNPSYVALFGILGWQLFTNKNFKNLFLYTAGAAALNEVVLDSSGVDVFQEGINMFMGNSELQKGNPASWAVISMEKNKELDEKDIDVRSFEKAATILGSEDFSGESGGENILSWYERTDSLLKNPVFDDDGTTPKDAYMNECMPKSLRKKLSLITGGTRDKDSENAQIAFRFLQKYFKHIDYKKNTNKGYAQASIENGKKTLVDKYGGGNSGKPYTMAEIFAQETTQEEQNYIRADRSKISEIFEENSEKAWGWISAHFDATTGGYENILKKYENVKNWAKTQGLKMKIGITNELEFWDGTKHAFSIVKNKAEKWILKPVTGFVGLGAGETTVGYNTFEEAWEGVKKGVNIVHAKAMQMKNKWIAFLSNIPTEKLKEKVDLSKNGIVKAVDDLDLTDEITETYGFDRGEYAILAVQEVSEIDACKNAIRKIAKYRMQIALKAKGENDVIANEDIIITNEDIVAYFLSGAYGIGKILQTGIDVARAGAEQVSRVASGTVGMLSPTGEAFLDSYGGDHALGVFLQDHIDGHTNFRNLAKKISMSSLNEPVSTSSRVIWTAENLQTVSSELLQKHINNIRKKPGSSPEKDIEIVKKILVSEFQRFFSSERNRELFYSKASNLSKNTDSNSKLTIPQIGPSKDQVDAGVKLLINNSLKKIDSNWELK